MLLLTHKLSLISLADNVIIPTKPLKPKNPYKSYTNQF